MSKLDLQLPEPIHRFVTERSTVEGYSDVGDYVVALLERLRQEDERDHERFRQLAARWKAERLPHSSSTRLTDHPAYHEIVALGRRVIPWLLAELQREPDHWFRALKQLTGVDPVRPENRGNIDAMAADWITWGRGQGYGC
jgi:hypothetical protein